MEKLIKTELMEKTTKKLIEEGQKEAKKSPAKRRSNPFHFLKIDEHSDC